MGCAADARALIASEPKVLYVITDLQLGGVPLHLYRLAQAMRLRGLRPTVVSLAPPGPVSQMLAEVGLEAQSCGGQAGWDFRVVHRLGRIIRRVRPDLIHALLFHGNLASRLASRWVGYPGKRIICEIQTVEVERRWHLLVDRWTNSWCRCIVGNSPSVVEHLATAARVPRNLLCLVRGGIDPGPIQAANPTERASIGVPASGRMIFWAGRLDPVKGLDQLIEAFAALPSDPEAHLVLAGDGPIRTALAAQARRLGLEARVHLLGARRDVPSLLKAADVFAFPSRAEGLPNALLEAMAAGCPIVATNVAGCRDLVEHEQNGLLVPYGAPRALSDAVDRLLNDRVLALQLGQMASETVTAHWQIRETFDRYESLYRSVLKDRA